MRFQTPDGSSFVQLDRRDEDGYAIFDVTASIEGLTGRNKSVIFTGCQEFLRQLHAFDAKRDGAVTLEGTEQCRLSIATFDAAEHMARVEPFIRKFVSDERRSADLLENLITCQLNIGQGDEKAS